AYMKKAFIDICEPERFSATPEDCLRVLKEGHFTSIHATLRELDVTFENRDDPTIFVFDPHKTIDLIDFWNLRQFQPNVFPVNVHWFDQFAASIRDIVKANFRPLPGNKHGVMIHPKIEFARSIESAKSVELLDAHMRDVPKGSILY